MSRALVNLVEAYERKYNPSGTFSGQRIAMKQVGADVNKLCVENKIEISRLSFKSLWESLVTNRGLEENLSSSAFPVIAGELISKVIIDGYTAFPKAGDRMVRTVPSRQKVSQIVGWKAIGRIRKLNEREPYGQVDPPDEKTVQIRNFKHGGTMDLTKESLFFDQTGELLDRARELGEEGARFREEIIMQTVTDELSQSLSNAELYNVANSNILSANPLGTTGWENAHTSLLDKKDDNTQKPIWVFGDKPILLAPSGLFPLAWKLQNNEFGPQGTANLDKNMAQNMFDVVVNPYLTKASTTWWYGGFKRQFRWEEVWPLETFTRVGQDTSEGFGADIIQQFKVSWYGGCGAADTRYVYENQA